MVNSFMLSPSLQLVKELGAPVEYIILPTFAYEHKIFVGPFSREFPRAQVWVAPRQWSWPLNLPLEFFGIFRARILEDEDLSTPWADEIEQKVLSSPEVGSPLILLFVKSRHTLLDIFTYILLSCRMCQELDRMLRWHSIINPQEHC